MVFHRMHLVIDEIGSISFYDHKATCGIPRNGRERAILSAHGLEIGRH